MIKNKLKLIKSFGKIRIIAFIICFIGWSIQMIQISEDCNTRETQIGVKFTDNENVLDIPAVTVCTERSITHMKWTLRANNAKLDQKLKTIDENNTSDGIKKTMKMMAYLNFTHEDEYVDYFRYSIKDKDFMACVLLRKTIYMLRKDWNLLYHKCSVVMSVMESKVDGYGKCFTYLSKQYLNFEGIDEFQIKATQGYIMALAIYLESLKGSTSYEFYYHKNSTPKVFMFIHNGNTMPSFDPIDAIELENSNRYDIRFWKSNKIFLKKRFKRKRFETNCFDYSINQLTNKSKSSEQCNRHCLITMSLKKYGCLLPFPVLAYDYKFDNIKHVYRCDAGNNDELNRMENVCNDNCKPDCNQTEYHYDVRKYPLSKDIIKSSKTKSLSFISLRHKSNGDIEHEHKRICSFDGVMTKILLTAVIWFGFSVFSFFNRYEKSFNKSKQYVTLFNDKMIKVMPLSISENTLKQNIIYVKY